MNEARQSQSNPISLGARQRIASVCDRFDRAWSAGLNPRIEDFLASDGSAEERRELLKALLEVEFDCRRQGGAAVGLEEYLQRFPELLIAV